MKIKSTKEADSLYGDQIRKLSTLGLGRVRIARKIKEDHGVELSGNAVSVIIKNMKSAPKPKPKPKPKQKSPGKSIEIIDNSFEEETKIPIDELIQLRIDACRRKTAKHRTHQRSLTLPAEPFGIMVFGDPHVDNDGCDWETLVKHVELVKQTPGVLAACVGDMHDNWIGRLAVQYAKSTVTASDGWRLSEWLFKSMQWIAICGGNHDAWAKAAGVDPMEIMTQQTGVQCYAPDELRIELRWRNREDLDPLIWILRHDFKGRSWYHPTHGPHKEAMLDGKCHLLTAGHIHQWGNLTTEQRHGRVTHAVRVRGYKRADSYAMEKGFFEQQYGESCLVVINPLIDPIGRIQIYWDLEEGCRYLSSIRNP